MQPEADLRDTVAFQTKIDTAAEAALRSALPLDRPAESFTAGPAGGGQSQELLGIAKLVAAVGRRHRRPPDHLGITALLHHRGKIAGAGRSKRHTGLRIYQDRHGIGKIPRGRQHAWRGAWRRTARSAGRAGRGSHQPWVSSNLSRRGGPTTGFFTPTMPERSMFTRLAEVNGDADCDRPLTFSSHV